jgi:hypothetical protein
MSCQLGGRPDRENPRIHLRLDPRILAGLEIVARKHGLTVHQVIYAMIEGYLAKVGGVAPHPPYRRGALEPCDRNEAESLAVDVAVRD